MQPTERRTSNACCTLRCWAIFDVFDCVHVCLVSRALLLSALVCMCDGNRQFKFVRSRVSLSGSVHTYISDFYFLNFSMCTLCINQQTRPTISTCDYACLLICVWRKAYGTDSQKEREKKRRKKTPRFLWLAVVRLSSIDRKYKQCTFSRCSILSMRQCGLLLCSIPVYCIWHSYTWYTVYIYMYVYALSARCATMTKIFTSNDDYRNREWRENGSSKSRGETEKKNKHNKTTLCAPWQNTSCFLLMQFVLNRWSNYFFISCRWNGDSQVFIFSLTYTHTHTTFLNWIFKFYVIWL